MRGIPSACSRWSGGSEATDDGSQRSGATALDRRTRVMVQLAAVIASQACSDFLMDGGVTAAYWHGGIAEARTNGISWE